MSTEVSTDTIRAFREQALSATVHRACTKCNAPGVFSDLDHVLMHWPGCYVTPDDLRRDTPVGPHCPNCQASRSPGLIKQLGEIWRRRFTRED